MDRESLEQLLGRGLSLAEIGLRIDRHEATVAYWVQKHGLRAVNRDKHAARGGLSPAQLEPLIERGATIAEIAEAVGRSKATVRHWLREYGLRTRRAACRDQAGTPTAGVIQRQCHRHGLTDFTRRDDSGYRCRKCRSEAVTRRRRKVKRILVQEAGGACQICGYDKCTAALEFHHLDRHQKRFSVSLRAARSLESLRAEASKCVLLCANCHAEVEMGSPVGGGTRTLS
jgi:Homeodomain-like domain